MKKNIEVWSDYDRAGQWRLNIRKKRGRLTFEEIREACMDYEQDFYLLVICAMDREVGQYYEVDDLTGDYVQLYQAEPFPKKWTGNAEKKRNDSVPNKQPIQAAEAHSLASKRAGEIHPRAE